MLTINATDARRDWSAVMETVVREKPQFIKRTRDYMVLADVKLMESLLAAYRFTAEKFAEDDGSVTLSLCEIDLVENGKTESEARHFMGKAILDYAEDYYKDYKVWSIAPNRKDHIPYVLKALILDDPCKIGEMIICQPGKS